MSNKLTLPITPISTAASSAHFERDVRQIATAKAQNFFHYWQDELHHKPFEDAANLRLQLLTKRASHLLSSMTWCNVNYDEPQVTFGEIDAYGAPCDWRLTFLAIGGCVIPKGKNALYYAVADEPHTVRFEWDFLEAPDKVCVRTSYLPANADSKEHPKPYDASSSFHDSHELGLALVRLIEECFWNDDCFNTVSDAAVPEAVREGFASPEFVRSIDCDDMARHWCG